MRNLDDDWHELPCVCLFCRIHHSLLSIHCHILTKQCWGVSHVGQITNQQTIHCPVIGLRRLNFTLSAYLCVNIIVFKSRVTPDCGDGDRECLKCQSVIPFWNPRRLHTERGVYVTKYVKCKSYIVTCQRRHREGRRGIAVPILNLSAKWGWVMRTTPQPLYAREEAPLFIVEEAGWRTSLTTTGLRTPDCLAPSKSLYQLCYPSLNNKCVVFYITSLLPFMLWSKCTTLYSL